MAQQGYATAPISKANSKLKEFFLSQLQDIYWAEKKMIKTLPKLQAAATTEQLKNAFGDHLQETKTHLIRLEQVFELLNEDPKGHKCHAMVGIAEEASDIIDDTDEGTAQRDVALIFAGQKVEHYEIATYGGLVQLARTMDQNEMAAILEQTLTEEKEADMILSRIAENGINYHAKQEKK